MDMASTFLVSVALKIVSVALKTRFSVVGRIKLLQQTFRGVGKLFHCCRYVWAHNLLQMCVLDFSTLIYSVGLSAL